MRLLLQRVGVARVEVGDQTVGEIGEGLLILLGVGRSDTSEVAEEMARKAAQLRVFNDDAGKMNLSLEQTGGAALVVSQFTLYADTSRGRRPSFVGAAAPEVAEKLVQDFCASLERLGVEVQQGQFGAHMKVSLTNDGPVTILLDSDA